MITVRNPQGLDIDLASVDMFVQDQMNKREHPFNGFVVEVVEFVMFIDLPEKLRADASDYIWNESDQFDAKFFVFNNEVYCTDDFMQSDFLNAGFGTSYFSGLFLQFEDIPEYDLLINMDRIGIVVSAWW